MQTAEQKQAFNQALVRGALLELVAARGGTGELRKPLTEKAYLKRKKRNKATKMARKQNRK